MATVDVKGIDTKRVNFRLRDTRYHLLAVINHFELLIILNTCLLRLIFDLNVLSVVLKWHVAYGKNMLSKSKPI